MKAILLVVGAVAIVAAAPVGLLLWRSRPAEPTAWEAPPRGWVVAVTDYPGLGTPGRHPFLDGLSEGRAVLDSVRASPST